MQCKSGETMVMQCKSAETMVTCIATPIKYCSLIGGNYAGLGAVANQPRPPLHASDGFRSTLTFSCISGAHLCSASPLKNARLSRTTISYEMQTSIGWTPPFAHFLGDGERMRCSRALVINIYIAQTTALGARAADKSFNQCVGDPGAFVKKKKKNILLDSLPDDRSPFRRWDSGNQ